MFSRRIPQDVTARVNERKCNYPHDRDPVQFLEQLKEPVDPFRCMIHGYVFLGYRTVSRALTMMGKRREKEPTITTQVYCGDPVFAGLTD